MSEFIGFCWILDEERRARWRREEGGGRRDEGIKMFCASRSHEETSRASPNKSATTNREEERHADLADLTRRTLGQEYINGRMRAQTVAINKAREEAQRKLEEAGGSGAATPAVAASAAPVQHEQTQEEREESSEAAALARATL